MSRSNHLTFLLLFTLDALSCVEAATEDDIYLAEIAAQETISLASGYEQAINRAPAVASVINARDIAASGATSLEQILESVPGLHVSKLNYAGNPIYSFRGIFTDYNPQTLVLVNGLPITNIFTGNRNEMWGGFPLTNVARIEVIRGPGSALYGADAFAGTINIVTKSNKQLQGMEYGVRLGSFDSKNLWWQYGGKLGAIDSLFYVEASETKGYGGKVEQDAQTALDGVFNTNASFAPGMVHNPVKALDIRTDLSYQQWRMRLGYQERKVGIEALAGALDPHGLGVSKRLYWDARYTQTNWLPNWDVTATLNYYQVQNSSENLFTLFPAGAFAGAFPNGMIGTPNAYERHHQVSLHAGYNGFDKHKLLMGVGRRLDNLYQAKERKNFTLTSTPFGLVPTPLTQGLVEAEGNPALVYMLPHQRYSNYVFVQDEWSFIKDWTLTAGLRYDRYSDFGSTTNPRLALVWDAAYNLTVKAMHGQAFRAPSFTEQYILNNPVIIGNNSIKPETMITNELAFNWQATGRLNTNLNFFNYRIGGMILPDPISKIAQNSGNQTGNGFELDARYDVSNNLQFKGSFSLQHATNLDTDKAVGLAPERRLYAQANWRFLPNWQVGSTVNYVADRKREAGDTRAAIPDYTMVGLSLNYNLATNWALRGNVINLFDANAKEPSLFKVGMPSDLPLSGRAIYLQLVHKAEGL